MSQQKRELIEKAGEIQKVLDAAPNSRVGTQWWTDRVNELARMQGQIDGMK